MTTRWACLGAAMTAAGVMAAGSGAWACAPLLGAQVDFGVTPTGGTGLPDGGIPGDGAVAGTDRGPAAGFEVVFAGWASSNSALTVSPGLGKVYVDAAVSAPRSLSWRVPPTSGSLLDIVPGITNPPATMNTACDASDAVVAFDVAPTVVPPAKETDSTGRWEIHGTGNIPAGLAPGAHVVCSSAQFQYWWDTVTIF